MFFGLAYELVNLFRWRLSNPELRRAQLQTLRERVFKVGALVKHRGEGCRRRVQRALFGGPGGIFFRAIWADLTPIAKAQEAKGPKGSWRLEPALRMLRGDAEPVFSAFRSLS